jgi:glucokinase
VCELVDNAGHTQSAQTIDWRESDIAGAFARIGPATVESDVRAAAMAEARFGGGRGVDELLFVTVGTGISCCLVLAGRPYPGARGNAICFGAPPVENAASGLALAAAGGRPWAEEVLADPSLVAIVEEAAAALGAGLAWLVNALDPGKVVIGGGLGLEERYRELAVAAMRPMIFADNTRDVPVVPAELGVDAGVIGAALAAVRGSN